MRIDAQQADALLAHSDLVVGARRGAADAAPWPHPGGGPARDAGGLDDAAARRTCVPVDDLRRRLTLAAGDDRVDTLDAQQLAECFLGDAVVANIVALGFAGGSAGVPRRPTRLERAIALNGVAASEASAWPALSARPAGRIVRGPVRHLSTAARRAAWAETLDA